MPGSPLVEMRQITKTFGPVVALRDVDFSVQPAEVVGLVGDNGAGKSTLMKVLTGVYQPDAGEIWFNERQVHFATPLDSRNAGIEMVYQDLALAENLTTTGNIFLGREITRRVAGLRVLDEREMARASRERIEALQIRLPSLEQVVERLSGGQRQSVAIARAATFQARLVIMDEPAASLAVAEAAKVLALIRRLREHDVSVILISHRLQDVLDVADRVVVLNRGANAGNLRRPEATMERIVSLIVGTVS